MKKRLQIRMFLFLILFIDLLLVHGSHSNWIMRIGESIRSFFNFTSPSLVPESILSSFNQDIIAWRGQHRQHRSPNIEILYHVGWHFSLLTLSMRVHSSGRSYIISFSWENYGKNTFSLCQWNQNQIHVLPSSIPL